MKNPVILPTATTCCGATIKGWVEVAISPGIGIHMVGLADAAVKETLLRVVTALQANGYHLPGKRIVINITRERGVDRRKHGDAQGWFDFPIALGILLASGQIDASDKELGNTIFVGELALDGKLRAPSSNGGFVSGTDAARAVSWKYRDERTCWGWDTDCKGGKTWLDVKDLADAVELLKSTLEDEKEEEA